MQPVVSMQLPLSCEPVARRMNVNQSVPTGVVTFLLTDVVGANELWRAFPDAMPEALAAHEKILRAAIVASSGYEFGTAGNSFAVAYSSSVDAIKAAAAAQVALASHDWGAVRIEVRIGLHSGQAEERDGRYFGVAVNKAARIEALAGPSQILVSQTTHALVQHQLDAALQLRDVGLHDLKSFKRPERLFQVVGEQLLAGEAIAPRRQADRLPTPQTRFIGRSHDVEAVAEILSPGALVTITGLGGLGKTRLSIEVARRAAPRFRDGIWWVDLSPLTDGAAVAMHTNAALHITSPAHIAADRSLVDGLRRLNAVVVFDNCEHVIDEVSALIATVHGSCPELAILATSRATLGVRGEQVWPIGPLATATDGVALLVDRATVHVPTFETDRWPLGDLVELCDRLDGMPLAIEMAAARLRALSPRDILNRLEDRFRLLQSRDRHVTPRHKTLVAALDWSYELLEPTERLLLDRLSVFASSFDLKAAEQVCADDDLDEFDILDTLTALLDRSLISLVTDNDSTRYRLLETVREYCSSHLSSGELKALRRRLIDHALHLVEDNQPGFFGANRRGFEVAFSCFEVEWDLFRDAVRYAVDDNDSTAAGLMLEGLWMFAFETFRTEIGDWGRLALTMQDPPLSATGVASVTHRNRREAVEMLQQALSLVDETTPSFAAYQCYGVLYNLALALEDPEIMHYAERAYFHAGPFGSLQTCSHRASLAMLLADTDPEAAANHAAFAYAQLAKTDNPWWAGCLPPLAMYEARSGRPEVGYEICLRGVEQTANAGLRWTEGEALASRAQIAVRYGVGSPQADLADAVAIGRESRSWFTVWLALSDGVPWLYEHGFTDLAHAVADFMEKRNIPFGPTAPGVDSERRARASLWASQGVQMNKDELVDYVLRELSGTDAASD